MSRLFPVRLKASVLATAVLFTLETFLMAGNLKEVGHPTFVSPHASPIAISGDRLFVVNTPSDTLDVIDTGSKKVVTRVNVGVDPVSVAVRPDGKEVWVSNHISDSVSVIDNDSSSSTYLQIVATIQEFDPQKKSTKFDEPVGIAFANDQKAYVALSSENEIAVIDVQSREIKKRLKIPAQDPRAIVVRDNRLYVIPFESNNKTQLSGGTGKIDGDLVTFNAWEHSVANNNVLSLGAVLDIIKNPRVPDRDLFVFDTATDDLIETVDTLGTLLYGLTVDSKGQVFIAQTDARNDVNGRSGTKKHGLAELENRAFLNQITAVDFEKDDSKELEAKEPRFIDLEPLPPNHPEQGMALATPFAIEISEDDSTLIVTAAGSDKLFTVDVQSGDVLGRADVGSVPRGIALQHADGKLHTAWVHNAVANTISVVDVSDAAAPKTMGTIVLEDPTHAVVKRGRIAFNKASASTTGTFSCASCHPDGHTDQLLWVLKTPVVSGGDQIMPRSTMPIRGLRDTAPYHWDGIPGDPYGGNNSANVWGHDGPNSSKDIPTSTTRHLIDGGLASTMAMVGDETKNDEGKTGKLTASERDDMATFLLSVPYPPAQQRAYDNVVSKRAHDGFRLFHIEGDFQGEPTPNVCGNCHRMPFLVSTNTPGTGMDAPTWRGAYDRFLILPQGRLNIIDFDFYRAIAEIGIPERNMWQFSWAGRRRFDPVWDMVLEGSTGQSGTFARQVTLNQDTADEKLTGDLLSALEAAATEGAVVVDVHGTATNKAAKPLSLQFDGERDGGLYVSMTDTETFTRAALIAMAEAGKVNLTFTARHGVLSDVDNPQPGIWTVGPIEQQRGRQEFPILYPDKPVMTVSGRHLKENASIFVDGHRVDGNVRLDKDELVHVEFESLPKEGMHLIQLQNPQGMFTNDFIFHVVANEEAASQLQKKIDRPHTDLRTGLADAAAQGNLERVKKLLADGARINARRPEGGSTPLNNAALHGRAHIVAYLLEEGAKVNATNDDGNTALHAAAFLCREEIIKLLLEKGASTSKKNDRGESPIDVVSGQWSSELEGFYSGIGRLLRIEIDVEEMERQRPVVAKLLREHKVN